MENPEVQLARQIIETTNTNLFLTGKAGTGKTTFLRELKQSSVKRMVVVAPTGIAAINAEGVTIHSFFQLPFAPFLPDTTFGQQGGQFRFGKEKLKILRTIDLLVIDEISMVRADLLDAVDDVLRRNRRNSMPFGGVQLVMIGDLGQLAPVAKEEEWQMLSRYYATPYFFSSRALARTKYAVVELTHVYRQSDAVFLELLNKVRDNCADNSVLETLNSRFIPDFQPLSSDGYIRLTTHNAQAAQINAEELSKLSGPAFTYQARIDGKFPDFMFPTDERLTLKKGAQVMFVKNDSSAEKRYYNGMIGIVDEIDETGFTVVPKDSDETILVEQEEWANSRYVVDEKTMEITEEVDGVFRQMPVKAAWAITIHKSQGLTFEHAIIDASSSFAHGQTYVALSRCKSLDGLVLSAPLPPSAIIRDSVIDDFARDAHSRVPNDDILRHMQRIYFLAIVDELFQFSEISGKFFTMMRIMNEHLVRSYPKMSLEFKARNALLGTKVLEVAVRFRKQYEPLVNLSDNPDSDEVLSERIIKASAYFSREISDIEMFIKRVDVNTDNKELRRRIDETLVSLKEELMMKHALLDYVKRNGFSVTGYLRHKSKVLLGGIIYEKRKVYSQRKLRKSAADVVKGSMVVEHNGNDASIKSANDGLLKNLSVSERNLFKDVNTDVVEALTQWRKEKSGQLGIPAYCVMRQESLLAIASLLPSTQGELSDIPLIGPARLKKYGEEILNVLAYCKKNSQFKSNHTS